MHAAAIHHKDEIIVINGIALTYEQWQRRLPTKNYVEPSGTTAVTRLLRNVDEEPWLTPLVPEGHYDPLERQRAIDFCLAGYPGVY